MAVPERDEDFASEHWGDNAAFPLSVFRRLCVGVGSGAVSVGEPPAAPPALGSYVSEAVRRCVSVWRIAGGVTKHRETGMWVDSHRSVAPVWATIVTASRLRLARTRTTR